MTLEEKIKMLMEAKNQELDKEGNPVVKQDEPKLDAEGNPIVDQDDSDDQDDDQDQDDSKKTDFGKNPTKVNEAATTADITAGKSRKDGDGGSKLAAPPSSGDKKDDNGSDARLKAGLSKKEPKEGVKGASVSGQNDQNKKNFVTDQSLETKPNKITVGEHFDAMFKGQELSEEFMTNAAVIFEAALSEAVESRLAEQVESLQEEFQVKLEEAVEVVHSELVENIDGFLNEAVKQWVAENQLAVESGIKVEMVTNFMDGLKTLFKESYIEVPEDKINVVEEQAKKIEELSQALVTIDEAHDDAIAQVSKLKREKIVESYTSEMTLKQKEKFATLCDGLEFVSEEAFDAKVKVVKESYFSPETKKQIQESVDVSQTTILNEDVSMNKYVSALSKSLKF